MGLMDANGFKYLMVGNEGHRWRLRFDTAFMILLRYLSFPARFADHIDEFNMPSNRIAEAFHDMSDFLYVRYAYKLSHFSVWTDMFPVFAQAFSNMDCPFDNNIALTDGNFMSICRPGGLGNWLSTIDPREFYSGKEKVHGIKFLAALFPNGITCLFGPSRGKTHDSTMMNQSGWLRILRDYELQHGVRMQLFGDTCFALSRYLQTMMKGFLSRRGSTFNL